MTMMQALAQCEHTLSKLEGCAREAVDDTAGAAQVSICSPVYYIYLMSLLYVNDSGNL
jgi:prephenate dehydratase